MPYQLAIAVYHSLGGGWTRKTTPRHAHHCLTHRVEQPSNRTVPAAAQDAKLEKLLKEV